MAHRAGGSNCNSGSCKFCSSQRILRSIGLATEDRNLTHSKIESIIFQWDRLLVEPSILPFCFRLTGSDGFIHLIGRTFVTCHQMDCLTLDAHSERLSYLSRFELILDQTLGKYDFHCSFMYN